MLSRLRAYQVPLIRSLKTSTIVQRAEKVDGDLPRLLLYTGTDCSLCDVVKLTLEDVRKEFPCYIEYYNIRDDSLPDVHRWRRLYQYDIPVLLLNGREIARHRLNKESLKDRLRALDQRGA